MIWNNGYHTEIIEQFIYAKEIVKMKVLRIFTAIALVISMLAMPVFAAEFVPSIEIKDGPQIVDTEIEGHEDCCILSLIPYKEVHDEDMKVIDHDIDHDIEIEELSAFEDLIRENLDKAYEELTNHPLNDLVINFEEKWKEITDGAPVENAIVLDLFETVLYCTRLQEFRTDATVTVSFTVDGLDAGDTFMIIHKPVGSEKWVIDEYTIDENGVITMKVDLLAPYAIIIDSGKPPVATEQSPQTGVSDNIMAAASVGAVILAAGAVLIGKKLRKNTVQ